MLIEVLGLEVLGLGEGVNGGIRVRSAGVRSKLLMEVFGLGVGVRSKL